MRLQGIILMALIIALALVVLVVLYGMKRWKSGTDSLHILLDRTRKPVRPATVDFAELEGLPEPVQRYFRAALTEGQPLITEVRAEQTGTFNLGIGTGGDAKAEKWKRFRAEQRVTTQRPGFIWDGRIFVAPGVATFVWDAYLAGSGLLVGELLGLKRTMSERGTPELAQSELMRFFGEAAWYPTALLPSQGVRWEAVDDTSAKATITDGDITSTALFRFDEEGLIDSFLVDRERLVDGGSVRTPWEGRFRSYEHQDGMHIPMESEGFWILADGPHPYWRASTAKLEYEFAKDEGNDGTPLLNVNA